VPDAAAGIAGSIHLVRRAKTSLHNLGVANAESPAAASMRRARAVRVIGFNSID
jgi:hypothetical protein